jgi:hypothetical protein
MGVVSMRRYAAFVSWGAMLLGTWEGYSMLRDHR